MANTANSELSTNFNVTPYYDDYDETKGFYRILYKPGFAVQARELTQMQTILQKQIDRFGKHVFQEGSLVIPGAFQLYSANTTSSVGPLHYIKIRDVDASNNAVDIAIFNDVELRGETSGVKAFANFVIDGTELLPNTSYPNTKTILVDYLSASNSNSSVITFTAGETLISNVGNLKVMTNDVMTSTVKGFGSAFRISSGVIFSKGHFIYFPTQEVVLDRYNDTPTCKVGFKVIENIITSSSDNSLLDPALEASNYSAPGADRFKLTAELQVRDINDPEDLPDFVTLFTIQDGIIQTITERTQYSIIRNEWAKRTFDESGDYYVYGLDPELREHLDTGTNGGVFSLAQSGNSSLISIKVSRGTAYVKGFEISSNVRYLNTPKSTAFSNVENQRASAFLGSYVTIDEIVGHLPTDIGAEVDLYNVPMNRISNGAFSSTGVTPTTFGQKIGTAKVAGIEYNSGTLGTAAGRADLYLMDIRMLGTNAFSSVRSVFEDNAATPDFIADIVADPVSNTTVLYEPFNTPLLYYTGSDFTRKIRNNDSGASDTSYEYAPTSSVTITGGTFTVSAPGSDGLPYSGTLTNARKRELFLSLGFAANLALGTTGSNVSGNTIVASGATFNKLNLGDKLEFSGLTQTTANLYTIVSIANSTYAVVDKVPPVTLSAASIFKAYKVGDYIDLTGLGFTSGTSRTVSAAGTQLSVNLGESITGSATITYRSSKSVAVESKKELRPSRFVQINCANSIASTTGPYSLGFSDVYRIKEVRKKTGSGFTTNTEGSVVTSQFNFDPGQKDTHYDHATITPIVPLTTNDRLLIELSYFAPDYSTGKGYFSVDSYPANDIIVAANTISTAEIPIYKSPTSGQTYDLRNYLDFRPVKANTSLDSTTVSGATINPSVSTTFTYSGTGISLVAPSSEIIYDYTYYLARKDVIHVNKEGVFTITRGVSAAIPVTPQITDNDMALAVLTIAPYPSISPYYAKIINRQDISCSSLKVAPIRQTMRDIGVMKERITNLEYYASLSLLEKNAVDLLITDAAGNDRFKNGIFVDTFADHQLGATYNPDYRIVVDPEEKVIRPLYSMQSIDYDYLSGTGVMKTGDLVTLSYSNVVFANISSATSTLNTEKSTYKFIGNLTLVPSEDVWIDTITLPPNIVSLANVTIDGMEDAQQVGGSTTTWNSWQTRVTGYKVYRGTGSNRTLVGSFSTRAAADRAAQNARTATNGATIETLYQSNRTGTEQFNYVDSDTASIGSRVVNTEIIPYIRPQTLMGSVTGLKPFAKFNVFFDDIEMSSYTRPVTETEFGNVEAVKTWTYLQGASMYANENGELWFRLSLPNSDNLRFTVGEKKVVVADNSTNLNDATSYAEKGFFAQGIIQTKQDTILSTRQAEVRTQSVSQSTNSSGFNTLPPLPPQRGGNGRGSCLAYVLPIKAPDGEEGLFLTAVEVFCAEKHPTLGVWFEIRELDAGGGITGNQVPFSEKWYKNSQVPLSTNGLTNGLKVTFDSPIFLYADKSYAFIIHPEAANPNYYFWISRIGEDDFNTGNQVTGRAFNGTLFTTNNDTIWIPQDQVDLTCRWYRAAFIPNGYFDIGNKPKEKIYIRNLNNSIEGFGEPIVSGDKITISGYNGANGSIVANDFFVGANSAINSRVISVTSGVYSMANIRYQSERVTVRFAANAAFKGFANVTSIENGRGFLEYYKESTNATYMILTGSNGNFSINDAVYDISDEGDARIDKIGNFRYSLIDFEPAIINFSKTNQSFELTTYSNTGNPQGSIFIDAGENYEFKDEMAIFSRSNEIASLSSSRSNRVRVNMSTASSYLSPVFDLGRTQSIIVDNLINNDATNETNASGGNIFNKYISKVVTLAEGQDAEDLKVYMTAYRPPNTDVRVWMKILNGEDSDTLALKSWFELEKSFGGDILYSSLANKNDFREFTFNIPSSMLTGTQGQVVYTNSQGITFTGFKSFQIKVGLLGTNSAIIPRVADLRTIALQI